MSDRALPSSLSVERDGEPRCTGCAWLGPAELCVVVSVERPHARISSDALPSIVAPIRAKPGRSGPHPRRPRSLARTARFTQRDFANTVSNTIRRLVAILRVPHRPPINVESELPNLPVELPRVGLTMQHSGSHAARRSM